MACLKRLNQVDAEEAVRILMNLPGEGEVSDFADFSGDEGDLCGPNDTCFDIPLGKEDTYEEGDTEEEESLERESLPPARRKRCLRSPLPASGSAKKKSSKKRTDDVPVWGEMDGTHNVQYPTFRGPNHGPTEAFASTSPIEFFELMWPNSLVDHIVMETNRYYKDSPINKRTGKKKVWNNDTHAEEMKALLGVIIFMGIVPTPEMTDYFTANDVLNIGTVSRVFTKNRLQQLWGNLHLANNNDFLPKDDPGHDKLHKLRPLLNVLAKTFKQYFRPGQNCAVDEHMVKGKGRNPLKQCVPGKPIKRGTKIWQLGCSCCGYIFDFQIYAGAQGNPEHGLSHRVVMDLASTLEHNQNHIIYFDNFFSSFQLLNDLRGIGMYGVGTMRSNRVGYPVQFKTKEFLAHMKKHKGEFHSFADKSSANPVLCTVWSDTKVVAFISNAHSAGGKDTVETKKLNGTKIVLPAPSMIKDYNKNMGAIDLHDQLQQSYETDRKSSRWWLRVFLDFLNAATVNAYILYKLAHTKANRRRHQDNKLLILTHKNFRIELIRRLIGTYTCRKLPGPLPMQLQPALLFRKEHTNTNLVAAINYKKGLCAFCCVGNGCNAKRTETRFGCVACKKRLCPGACHDSYHREQLKAAGQ